MGFGRLLLLLASSPGTSHCWSLMGRAPCCDKNNVKKGPWSPEEDAKLKEFIEKHGTGGNWIALPQKAGSIYICAWFINLHIHRVIDVMWLFISWFGDFMMLTVEFESKQSRFLELMSCFFFFLICLRPYLCFFSAWISLGWLQIRIVLRQLVYKKKEKENIYMVLSWIYYKNAHETLLPLPHPSTPSVYNLLGFYWSSRFICFTTSQFDGLLLVRIIITSFLHTFRIKAFSLLCTTYNLASYAWYFAFRSWYLGFSLTISMWSIFPWMCSIPTKIVALFMVWGPVMSLASLAVRYHATIAGL